MTDGKSKAKRRLSVGFSLKTDASRKENEPPTEFMELNDDDAERAERKSKLFSDLPVDSSSPQRKKLSNGIPSENSKGEEEIINLIQVVLQQEGSP